MYRLIPGADCQREPLHTDAERPFIPWDQGTVAGWLTWLMVLAMLTFAAPALAQNIEPVSSLAIERVTIIDPTAESEEQARIPNQTVLIAGNRIEQVGPADTIIVPDNVPRIDGRGRFLIPGFWDMHAHFNRDTGTQLNVMAPLMIAHGITGVRDMLSDC